MKVIFIYFLYFLVAFSSEKYVPKNIEEKKVLEKYKNIEISVGVEKSFIYDDKLYNNQSLNDIIYEMFSQYLGLNVKFINGDWDKVYNKFLNKEIDILVRVDRTYGTESDFLFTDPIMTPKLYLASKKSFPPNYFENLSGKTVYLKKNSFYNEYFYDYLLENNQTPNIIYTNDKFKHMDELILAISPELPYFKSRMTISNIPGRDFGLQKSHKELLPILNNILQEKYFEKLDFLNRKRAEKMFTNNFLNSLTEEEKNYISNLESLNVLSKEILLGNYSFRQNNIGLSKTLILLDILSQKFNIKYNKIETLYERRGDFYRDFEKGNLDMIPLSKTKERLKSFYFTQAIDSINLYKITNYDSESDRVGVIKDTIESSYISEFYLKDDIVYYPNAQELICDLKDGVVKSGFLFTYDEFNLKKHDIKLIKNFPMHIAVRKEDEILGRILDKAISNIFDLGELQEEANKIDKENQMHKYKKKEMQTRNLSIVLGVLIALLLLIIHRVLMKNTLINKLKKDSLTGLLNRESFKVSKVRKIGSKGYALLIDIDSFKEINEKYGFKAGDEILIDIAKILREIFSCKEIYRVSSNEFYIYFQDENIESYLLKLKNRIDSMNQNKGGLLELSLSIGYFYRNNTQITIDEAFNFADMAMYEAKEVSGTCYIQANQELINRRKREKNIKSHLRSKDLQGIYPVFQPKFSVETKKIIGAEALARWKNEALGFISPGEFIPIAEKIKLIHLIDYKISEESVKSVRKWLDMGVIKEDFKLSFNISMETFNRDDIVKHLLNLLEMYKVPGKFLEIEVTESIFSSDLNKVLKKIEELKEKDYEISIDDFTAGHSAATLLSCIPASVIKFDKSILDTIKEGDTQSETIYKNLIALAKDLKMKIVSEGVETEYQLNFLKENSVDIAQGFLLSRPLEERDLLEKYFTDSKKGDRLI